jgi:hypothetical protein
MIQLSSKLSGIACNNFPIFQRAEKIRIVVKEHTLNYAYQD